MNEEKRMIGSYEVEHSIHLGDKEVILGVDKKEQYPFMVCYCTCLLYTSDAADEL